jgi:putative sigma-54 modulation protein
MNIQVHAVQFSADKKLVQFVEEKLGKLTLFNDHIVNAEVFLKLGSSHEVENKICEIKITVPNKELFAKKQAKSFEEATDLVIEALRKQALKEKDKAL